MEETKTPRRRPASAAVAALIAALLAGCQTAPAPSPAPSPAGANEPRAAIEAAHARLVAAYNACDADAFVAAYGSAFTFVSSSTRAPLTAPGALRDYLAGGCKAPPAPAVEIRRQEVTVTGITALVTGQYLFRVPAGAARIDVPQHYTMVMRRAGNDWRVVAHHLSIVPPAAR